MTTTKNPTYETLSTYTVWSRLDNHDPAHEYFRGKITVVRSRVDPSEVVYRLEVNEAFMARISSGYPPVFLLDDGESVIPLYVSGWGASMSVVALSRFPNWDTDLETNPESIWALGPRTCYHMKTYE